MAEETDDPAKARFFMLQLVRLGGLLLILGGILIVTETISGPMFLGAGLLLLGMFEFFFLPVMMARRWKSPPQ